MVTMVTTFGMSPAAWGLYEKVYNIIVSHGTSIWSQLIGLINQT